MSRGTIAYDELISYSARVLEELGYPKEQAEVTAWVLVEADARGVASHGVARIGWYQTNIENGFAFPQALPEIVHETPLSLVVDGHNGIGTYIAQFTMTRVVEKAKSSGAGFGAVRNSNHFGMAGIWAERRTNWPRTRKRSIQRMRRSLTCGDRSASAVSRARLLEGVGHAPG